MLRVVVVGFAVVLLSGCLHRAECRRHGGDDWHEVSSPHFKVRSDAPLEKVYDEVGQLETLRKVLFLMHGVESDVPDQLKVVFLDDPEELHEFTPYNGYMIAGARLMVATADRSHVRKKNWTPGSTILHELAHDVTAHVLMRSNRWLAEGLASYLETTRIETEGGPHAVVGLENSPRLWVARNRSLVTFEELWGWKESLEAKDPDLEGRMYAASWLWIHFLMNRHYEDLHRWMQRLQNDVDPRVAFDAVFGKDHHALEQELAEYVRTGAYSSYSFPISAEPPPMTERELEPSLVHLERARLAGTAIGVEFADNKERYQKDIKQAVEWGPNVFEVRAALVRGEWGDRRDSLARKLVSDFPDEAEAHFLLSTALNGEGAILDERLAELQRAIELDPKHAEALNSLAWEYVIHGRGTESLPLAKRSVELTPWDANRMDTLAAAYAAISNCEAAAAIERRAVELLPERTNDERRQEFTKRVDDFSKPGCESRLPTVTRHELVKRKTESGEQEKQAEKTAP